MKVLRTIEEMRQYRQTISTSIAFVPTMGALHDGHCELIKHARIDYDLVIVSIYVNSAQFAIGEDLDRYPSTPKTDEQSCANLGVDVIFMPTENDVYPDSHASYIRTIVGEPNRNKFSEGASRPTFFRGVATVLCKLLTVVRPDALYCGQKDAQQCAVMELLRRVLWPCMKLCVVDTVREVDGLAMSSRNTYLSTSERSYAPAIYRALQSASALFKDGSRCVRHLRNCILNHFEDIEKPPRDVVFDLLYVSVCHKTTLIEICDTVPEPCDAATIICVAAKMGDSRLIDNIQLS